jgi:hypothetical protein
MAKLMTAAVTVLMVAGVVWAGEAPERPGGDRRGDRRGRFDPAQMRERMMERMKEQLTFGDEEWEVVKPRLEKVMTLSRDASGGGRYGMFGRRGRRDRGDQPQEDAPPESASQKAMADLLKVLENEQAPAEEIKLKLKALREAREKAKQDLAKARESLRELLSQRQEAQLVAMGVLD